MSQKEREIWEACDDLLAMGKKPREITGEAIGNRLRELGYKAGNLNYRYKYRDSWMAARGLSREDDEIRKSNKPLDIIERSAALFSKTIEEEIRKEYETKYQETETKITALTEQLAERLQVVEHLNNAYETLSQANTALTQERYNQQLTLEETNHQLTAAKTRANEYAKQLADNAAHYQQQLTTFETAYQAHVEILNQKSQQQETQYRETLNLLKEQNEKQRHQYIVELDNLRTENQKLVQQLQQLLIHEQQLKTGLANKSKLLADNNKQLSDCQVQQKTTEQQIKSYEQKVTELLTENTLFQRVLIEQQEPYATITKQLTALQTTVEQLPKRLTTKGQGKLHDSKT